MGEEDKRDAERYRKLRSLGRANEKHPSRAIIGDRLKAKVAFRYWCSPEELDEIVDGIQGE